MNFVLSVSDREILENYRKSSSGKKDFIRCTVLLSLDQGKSPKELSDILGVDLSSIYNYVKSYTSLGLSGFISSSYLGSWGKLDSFQLAALDKELRSNLHQSSFSVAIWIKENFGISYALGSLPYLLKRLGFVYKKTKLVAAKADKNAQLRFLDYLKTVETSIEGHNSVLLFADAVHPEWNTRSNYAWIPKGEEAQVKSVGSKRRINLLGTVNVDEPSDVQLIEATTIDSQTVITFLEVLEKVYADKDKVYIVVDRATYFMSYLVEDWLSTSHIAFIYLPACSPNLNLIERVWKFMRKKVIDYTYYDTFEKFRTNVLAFFKYIDDYIDELETLLVPNFHV